MDAALRADLAARLHELADRLADDRATVGELAGAVARHDDELAEVRDDLLELSGRIDSLGRVLDARTERAA